MLTLHSYRRCPFAIRVRMVLEEKGLEYQVVEEKLSDLSAELLALHPEGRVPLLIDESEGAKQVIYQSTVITEYLDEKFPTHRLMPNTPEDRARVRLWTYWCDHLFKPDLDLYKYERKNMTEEDNEKLESRLHALLREWDSALSVSEHLVGPSFSLADLHLFPFARQFMAIQPAFPELDQYAHLSSWLEKTLNRPAFSRVMAK